MVARSGRGCEEWWQGVEGIVKSGGKEEGAGIQSDGDSVFKEWERTRH